MVGASGFIWAISGTRPATAPAAAKPAPADREDRDGVHEAVPPQLSQGIPNDGVPGPVSLFRSGGYSGRAPVRCVSEGPAAERT
jgi:hypothetical protein